MKHVKYEGFPEKETDFDKTSDAIRVMDKSLLGTARNALKGTDGTVPYHALESWPTSQRKHTGIDSTPGCVIRKRSELSEQGPVLAVLPDLGWCGSQTPDATVGWNQPHLSHPKTHKPGFPENKDIFLGDSFVESSLTMQKVQNASDSCGMLRQSGLSS